jgi:BNR repeat-like domain/BNR/Asp-box repeat
MRRLALLVVLVLVAPAAAATIPGTPRGELLIGSVAPDRIKAGAGNDFVQAAFGGIDQVDCGAGNDIVSADLGDHVVNCETVARRLSVDPYVNKDSQHETAVEPDSFSFGSTIVTAFQLGRRGAGAAANIGTAVSHDNGQTWQRSTLPGVTIESQPSGPELAASDPTVAYDALQGTWLVGTLTVEPDSSHVYVARSTDGVHWSTPVDVAGGPILDKDWLVCDNSTTSPFRGRCYAEYTDDQQNETVSQFSTDGGATWSTPVHSTTALVGTQPVVRADGTLVVVAGDYIGDAALTGSIVAVRSTDGGLTFTRTTVSNLVAHDNDPMRAVSLPSVDIDSAGTIYAVWHDCRFRTGCTENDMVLSTSPDGGLTWTAPTRVPIAPLSSNLDVFIPGLAADPTRPGHLALVYASFTSTACRSGACTLGIGFTTSNDGGATWSTPERLDAQPFSTNWLPRAEGGRMVGDYFSTSFAGDRVVPVFALATTPLGGRFREAIFAASLPAGG